MSDGAVLVTGASGYLGGLVARRYRDAGYEVLGHSRRAVEAEGVVWAAGDLADDAPFAAVDPQWWARLTHIVHAGAITRFDVDRRAAQAVNVDGTAKVLDLARGCPRLTGLGLVSTVYATGLRAGPVDEALYDDGPGFANEYEWSKWQAEQLVAAVGPELPWRILRVATIVADDATGRVTQHNAFHETLKLWFHGLLPLVPGHADTPLYLVTGDVVADAVVTLVESTSPGGVYHLAPDASASPSLAELLDIVSAAFDAVESFRRRRVLRPLLGDEESFDLLARGVDAFGGGLVRQSLQSVVPFARQLFVAKELSTARLHAALPDHGDGDVAELVRHTCEWLVATRWGRRDVA